MTELLQFSKVKKDDLIVEMVTNMGSVQIKMFPEQAPKTVANFVAHAKSGYYEGIIFHRVIKDFMIQGGDPTGTGMGGTSIYGEKFEDEFSMDLCHFHGALSMANAGPNTNGSQFFIVHASKAHATKDQLVKGGWTEEQAAKYVEVGGTPHLDGAHTVFGQVVVGLDIINTIANVKVGGQDRPKEEVKIVKMNVIGEKASKVSTKSNKSKDSNGSKDLVFNTLKESANPLKGKEVAEISGVDAKEVTKAIKELVKEGKVNSPKRCFYAVVK